MVEIFYIFFPFLFLLNIYHYLRSYMFFLSFNISLMFLTKFTYRVTVLEHTRAVACGGEGGSRPPPEFFEFRENDCQAKILYSRQNSCPPPPTPTKSPGYGPAHSNQMDTTNMIYWFKCRYIMFNVYNDDS